MNTEITNKKAENQAAVSGSAFGFIIIDKKGNPLLKDAKIPVYWLKKIAIEESENFKETTVKKVVVSW